MPVIAPKRAFSVKRWRPEVQKLFLLRLNRKCQNSRWPTLRTRAVCPVAGGTDTQSRAYRSVAARSSTGTADADEALDGPGITCNKNSIPQ